MLEQFVSRCIVYWLHLKTAFTVYNERYRWWMKALYILSASCKIKCETLSLNNSQPPTSPPLTMRKAIPSINCRYQFSDPEGMDIFVS